MNKEKEGWNKVRNIGLWIVLFISILLIGFIIGWYTAYDYLIKGGWEIICSALN